MYALRIGSDAYVREYRYCTLAHFAATSAYNKEPDDNGLYWVWIDRTAFWSDEEHLAFINTYTNYYYKPHIREVWPTYVRATPVTPMTA